MKQFSPYEASTGQHLLGKPLMRRRELEKPSERELPVSY